MNEFFSIVKKWAILDLFLIYFCLFKQTIQFFQQINVINGHRVYCTGIRTHDLWNTSLLPQPLDQVSPHLFLLLPPLNFGTGHNGHGHSSCRTVRHLFINQNQSTFLLRQLCQICPTAFCANSRRRSGSEHHPAFGEGVGPVGRGHVGSIGGSEGSGQRALLCKGK